MRNCKNCQCSTQRRLSPHKPMMHIPYIPYFQRNYKFHLFASNLRFLLNLSLRFLASPILTVMHLRIVLYTYWTSLVSRKSCSEIAEYVHVTDLPELHSSSHGRSLVFPSFHSKRKPFQLR